MASEAAAEAACRTRTKSAEVTVKCPGSGRESIQNLCCWSGAT